jgi:hypothetical protein
VVKFVFNSNKINHMTLLVTVVEGDGTRTEINVASTPSVGEFITLPVDKKYIVTAVNHINGGVEITVAPAPKKTAAVFSRTR